MLPDNPPISLTRIAPRAGKLQWDRCDAVLIALPAKNALLALSKLAYAATLHTLCLRCTPTAGQHAAVNLPNKRQTLAVVMFVDPAVSAFELQSMAGRAAKTLLGRQPRQLLALANGLDNRDADSALQALLLATLSQSFALPNFAARPRGKVARRLQQIRVVAGALDLRAIAREVAAQNLARWLTALPPNKLATNIYRRLLAKLARSNGLRMRWYDERALTRLGAGAFLAVSRGNASRNAAGIAHLSWRPARKRGRGIDVALIGKGILFDTGGTNLKQHRSMLDMHTDMAGSAVAVCTLLALAQARSPLAVDAWLAITENRIGPTAYIPQEVVRASNGVTIQVIHTDAEGRMALADTLAIAGRTRPKLMIDFATLTGACVYALTERMSGVFANREPLMAALLAAGRNSGERVVGFPMDADFDSDIESKVADVMQCNVDGKGDHILAARFLQRFVPKESAWAHVDLSSATRTGGLGAVASEITGFGVRLTLNLLSDPGLLTKLSRP